VVHHMGAASNGGRFHIEGDAQPSSIHTNPAPSRDRWPWGASRFPQGLLGHLPNLSNAEPRFSANGAPAGQRRAPSPATGQLRGPFLSMAPDLSNQSRRFDTDLHAHDRLSRQLWPAKASQCQTLPDDADVRRALDPMKARHGPPRVTGVIRLRSTSPGLGIFEEHSSAKNPYSRLTAHDKQKFRPLRLGITVQTAIQVKIWVKAGVAL
jgi:hypothetical protein